MSFTGGELGRRLRDRAIERWIVVETVLAVALLLGVVERERSGPRVQREIDLPSFLLAGRAVLEQESPYDDVRRRSLADELEREVHPFLHPALSAPLFVPLALVPFDAAARLVAYGNALLGLALLHFLFRRAGLDRRPSLARLSILALWLLGAPLVETIHHAQINLLALALIAIAWECELADEWGGSAGVALGVATALKQTPALLLAAFVVRRRWRGFLAAAASLSMLLVVAAVTLPERSWREWSDIVVPSLGYGETPYGLFHPAHPFNQSLNGFFARFFLESPMSRPLVDRAEWMRPLCTAVSLIVLALTAFGVWRSREPAASGIDLSFALLSCASFLVSPLSWEHHLVLIAPALVVAWRLAGDRPRIRWVRPVLVLAATLISWRFELGQVAWRNGWATLFVSIPLAAVVTTWAILLLLALTPGAARIRAR